MAAIGNRVPSPDAHRTRTGIALATLLALAGCDGDAPTSDRPNVVIVLLDTLRPDRLGVYGCERDTSPRIDSLADGFFVFENAQSAAPWTAPALISLMTSSYPDVHGVQGFPIPDRLTEGLPTLAEVLRRVGYDSAAFTEGGYAKGDFGLDRGFRTYPDNPGDAKGYASNLSHPSRLASNLDRTIEWLGEEREDPFFVFFHTYEVHLPLRAPEEDIRAFVPDFDEAEHTRRFEAAIADWNQHRQLEPENARALSRRMFQLGFSQLGFAQLPRIDDRRALMAASAALGVPLEFDVAIRDPENRQWVQDIYDAEVHYTDRQLQRLWDALTAQGLDDNTIVVVISDHGESLGEHGRLGHGEDLHEELLRVVLMVRAPQLIDRSRRVSEIVRSVDVMPTVLELVGYAPEDLRLQGRSLVPLMQGGGEASVAFSHASHAHHLDGQLDRRQTVRTDRWRLILDPASGAAQLFDSVSDVGETSDVSAEYPDVVAELVGLLGDQVKANALLRAEVGEPGATDAGANEDLLRDLEGLGYTGRD